MSAAYSRGPGHAQQKQWSITRKLLKAFCPLDTFTALFERPPTRPLAGLDGLRSFSMMWIIFAHSSTLSIELGTDDQNALQLSEESLPQQFTLGASLAIDTFFFLSGLLTTYTLLRRTNKNGRTSFPVIFSFFLRYLRLTPLYAFLLFFFTYVVPFFGHGPVWYRMLRETGRCETWWWTNLLYINNLVPATYHLSCMPWSWYLACDMQFFVISLILLSVYLKARKIGVGIVVVMILGGTATAWMMLYEHRNREQDSIFDKPYTRCAPFGVGMLLGILLVDYKWRDIYGEARPLEQISLRPMTSGLLMLGSLTVMVAMIYVDYTNFHPTLNSWTRSENASYQAIGRLGYALALAVVTLLCVSNNSYFVNTFLSLGFWEPVGKLTYGAYLVHPIIIRSYYFQQVVLFHFVPFNQIVVFFAMTIISYIIAAWLFVMVELPFANVTKMFISRWRPQNFGGRQVGVANLVANANTSS